MDTAKVSEIVEVTKREILDKFAEMGFEPRIQVVNGWWWVKIEGSPSDYFPNGKWRRADSILGWNAK